MIVLFLIMIPIVALTLIVLGEQFRVLKYLGIAMLVLWVAAIVYSIYDLFTWKCASC